MNIYAQRIEDLRSLMRSRGWDAVIVTGQDPHGSEFPARRWQQVEWLSGFTGEAGDIVVTLDHAGLWTDSRYFIQAGTQLEGTGIVLHKTRVPDQVLIPQWLHAQAAGDPDYTVAVDGLCYSVAEATELADLNLVSVPDMLDIFWKDRPCVPQTPIFQVYSGEDRPSKIAWLRKETASSGCDGILLTALDDIAWLLNVRASDLEYNPMVISYLLVQQDSVKWFVQKQKVEDPDTEDTFIIVSDEHIELLPYDRVDLTLNECSDSLGRLMVDCGTLNYQLWQLLDSLGVEMQDRQSPVQLRKAVKNPVEIEMLHQAHLQDGLAVERFLYWLETSLQAGDMVSEWEAARKLGDFRAEIEDYQGDSFETISAYGPGAALPHYITPKENAPWLGERGLYLCDSGGQFLNGTTDITRTVPLGECSALEREDYTLVLKAHIDLAMAVFPAGTAGCQIDALAREPLWKYKRNFGHGTGHGVGFFLGCHEGPQDVRQNFNRTPLLPGMVLSDEPGIYREGKHGVRHENLLLVCEDGTNDFGKWLRFEPLTQCHFDTAAIVTDLLNQEEIDWLNEYNRKVYSTLRPFLSTEVGEWLKEKTQPLEK